jgi:hypothetical protein
VIYVEYDLPSNGLGTDFSQFERPITFAETYTNRFRNITGGAERRPGMGKFAPAVTGTPNLTRLHEWVSDMGTEVLLSSDDFGNIWYFNASASAFDVSRTGGSSVRYISAQAEDKLIMVNGVDRNIYTNDGGLTWSELKAYITRGVTAGGTTTTSLVDGDISNWIGATLVSNNDIVYNVTRNGYGIVSTVASAALTTTVIGTAGNGAGRTSSNQVAGDQYQLIDYVDLNVIPQGNGSKDNVATATTGTTQTVIAVSGVNFANTEIRAGDFVYNTTRAAIAQVGTVSANINLQQIVSAQVVGDSLAFFKSAMPIASWVHVHYGRVYYLDSRNQRNVVISAPDDAEDVTTYQKTLDATSFSWGTQQPSGDTILTLGTFQSYFVAGGKKNIYIYNGNTPILDTSSSELDFTPVATYPDGAFSRFSLISNGANLLYETDDGLQAISIGNISNTTVQNNVSTPIKNTLTSLIQQTTEDGVQLTFYPTRSWIINKVGSQCFILNNTPTYNDAGQLQVNPAWHLFTGPWAQQNHYFVRRNGDLLGCGSGGLVYYLDNGDLTDDGQAITTNLTTAWLTMEEPRKTVRIKQLQYIKPVFESGANVEYTVDAVAGWDNYSADSITVSAGGNGQIGVAVIGQAAIGDGTFAQAQKYPLRVRGEEFRLQFTTESSAGPDIITGLSVYGEVFGAR